MTTPASAEQLVDTELSRGLDVANRPGRWSERLRARGMSLTATDGVGEQS